MLESRLGSLRDPDREVAGQVGPSILVLHPCHLKGYGQAHISLKKTWAAHFNMWINNRVDRGALTRGRANFGLRSLVDEREQAGRSVPDLRQGLQAIRGLSISIERWRMRILFGEKGTTCARSAGTR